MAREKRRLVHDYEVLRKGRQQTGRRFGHLGRDRDREGERGKEQQLCGFGNARIRFEAIIYCRGVALSTGHHSWPRLGRVRQSRATYARSIRRSTTDNEKNNKRSDPFHSLFDSASEPTWQVLQVFYKSQLQSRSTFLILSSPVIQVARLVALRIRENSKHLTWERQALTC